MKEVMMCAQKLAEAILNSDVYQHMHTLEEQVTQDEAACIENITVTDYQPISFDITAGGVHKGNAIKAVLQSLHLKKEEFMAFGDAMNDLPMFAEAGLTVAMANAAEEIQASCDIVTADYMDDGVAKAIQRYIL